VYQVGVDSLMHMRNFHMYIPIYRMKNKEILRRSGMSNMRPFASTPAARTKDTVFWSFNGQNCSFYNLTWINGRRSQINGMIFFIQNVFYTLKYERLFPSVKSILNKKKRTLYQACQTCGPRAACRVWFS
jgi:hypothetical protein